MFRRTLCILVMVVALCLLVSPTFANNFLSFLEYHEDATNLNYLNAVMATLDGKFVVTAGLSGDVSTFSRDAGSGALTLVDHVVLQSVLVAQLSPDDRHLYLATGYGDSVAAYSRDLVTGELTAVGEYKDGEIGIDGLDLAASVTVSPDGKHVYAGGLGDDGVAVFSRNSMTGELTFVEVHLDGANGVDGIADPRGIVVSPDGAFAYVAGSADNSVAVFSRNAMTGSLTWAGKVTQGVDGVAGLNGVFRVSIDPNGDHIYTGGSYIAVFERDAGTGLLTYVEDHYLPFSRGLAVDHYGALLIAASVTGDSVSVYARDPSTGELTFSSLETEGVNGVSGLDGAGPLVLDPTSSVVYVGCEYDTLSVFQIGIHRDGFESGGTGEW